MRIRPGFLFADCRRALCLVVVLSILFGLGLRTAQSQVSRSAGTSESAAGALSPEEKERAIEGVSQELFRLLRVSPKLATVLSHDPSLLGDQEYVSRNNPELAQFLQSHPEIGRSPEFYLFGNLGGRGGRSREQRFTQAVWPETPREDDFSSRDVAPFLVLFCVVGLLVWLIRVLLENHRWAKTFKVQTETYNKLLDKFSASEELLNYVRSDTGRRFLETALIPFHLNAPPHAGSALSRMLRPLQVGVVLVPMGVGLLFIRSHAPHIAIPLLIFGTLAFMLGAGFIASSGIAFVLARRLGLLPPHSAAPSADNLRTDTREPL